MRPGSRLAAAGAALIVVGLGAAVVLHGLGNRPPSLVGRTAPPLAIATAPGSQVSDRDPGGRPVVVNFWASWCRSCAQEQPILNVAAGGRPDISFMGVDIQDTPAGAQAFESADPVAYPNGPIASGSYLDFGVTAPPESFFLDRRGRVVGHIIGPLTQATLKAGMALAAGS